MARKDIVAMILAGGQGSRLGALTKYLAKPAVPYGSRYRIIDFPLSNCTNSGIDTVGVLTQYQPLALNTYIGNGHPWDLDRNNGGAFILPPYQKAQRSDWYKGTANAIYQNTHFIDNYNPKYVLILSGDHIYKMNYANMLRAHINEKAEATIAVLEVPWEETSRFGIMNTDSNGTITEFEEKPKKAESNLASMGVYIFNWDVLRCKLAEDEADPKSSNDFGKNVIPAMLNEGYKLFAYRFEGYWKDVGTVSSLWEANMDILDLSDQINLNDGSWRIYSKNPVKPANYVAAGAKIRCSAMTDGCVVYGTVEHSVLSNSVRVEKGAVVIDSVLMPGVTIEENCYVNKCIVGMGTTIGKGTRVGETELATCKYTNAHLCSNGISVIAENIKIRENVVIPGNCMVEAENDEPDEIIECVTVIR